MMKESMKSKVKMSRTRQYNDSIASLQQQAMQLSTHPQSVPAYQLRLYPLSLERSALLAQLSTEEKIRQIQDVARILRTQT